MMIDGNIAVDDITLTFGACGEAILFDLGDLTNQPGQPPPRTATGEVGELQLLVFA